jgi:hypothetical protein
LPLLLVAAIGCASGGYYPRARGGGGGSIGVEQQRQRQEIEQGARHGDLDAAEELILRDQSRKIDQQRKNARADDGRISPAERRQIKKKQRQLDDAIQDNERDADRR